MRWLCLATVMKSRFLAAVLVPLAALVLLLGLEFSWRFDHRLAKPPAPSPDGAFVAEVRSLPEGQRLAPYATGVFLRGRWAWLRSLRPQLVFTGYCEQVETRWFGNRRLVIECELRSGEPRLLQAMVDDVVIELVVQRQFAWHSLPAPRRE